MDFREGQQVTPTLRLRRLLGRGGMGSVWLAEHLALQTQVAVKFLSPEYSQSPEAAERFRREATAAAQIRSPHVVQTLDHGLSPDGLPYIVLELLEGEELGVRMEREPQMSLSLVVRIVTQACKALAKAHGQSIVHRDIKPDNLFLVDVDGEPFVKVLDFGIAKKTDDRVKKMTSTKAIIGTPYYMSPEQALSSRDVDPRADLWSLSVVAYFALTGAIPFDGETVGAICVAIDRAIFLPPSRFRPDLPPSMDAWFARAFARDITKRFQSARELADSFAVAAGEEAASMSVWSARGTSLPGVPVPALSLPGLPAGTHAGAAPSRPRWPWFLGVGAVVLAGTGALLAATRPSARSAIPAQADSAPAASAPAPAATAPASAAPQATAPASSPSPASPPPADSAAPQATATGKAALASGPAKLAPGKAPAGKAPPEGAAKPAAPPAVPAPTGVDRGF